MMIDFDIGKERLNNYLGAEKKTTVLYNDEIYMLKYPDPVRASKIKGSLSYKNNQFSEHVGCSVFRSCGFNTQETVLGYFTDNSGKRKIVVGCKDFTQQGGSFYEAKKLQNQSSVDHSVVRPSLDDVYAAINENPVIPNKQEILDGFWDMFVIDCLIGNGDRHMGNWGIIVKDGTIELAPVYDCGSSLGALLSDDEMAELLEMPQQFKNINFNKVSCYQAGGKKIFYHEIFKNPPEDLKEAIKRIVPKIDMTEIYGIVDSVPEMSDIRKEYLKKAINLRYAQILAPALKRELANEQEKPSVIDQIHEHQQKIAQTPHRESGKKHEPETR